MFFTKFRDYIGFQFRASWKLSRETSSPHRGSRMGAAGMGERKLSEVGKAAGRELDENERIAPAADIELMF